MKTTFFLASALISLLFVSCTSSQYVQTNPVVDGQSEIAIIFEDQETTMNYEIIGHIETSGWIFTSNKALIKGLRKKAQKEGADAVIDVEFNHIPHLLTAIPSVGGIAVKYK